MAAISFAMSADADVEAIAEPDAERSLDSDADTVMLVNPAVVAASPLVSDTPPLADAVTDDADAMTNATTGCELGVMPTAPDAASPFDSEADADVETAEDADAAMPTDSETDADADIGHDAEAPNSTDADDTDAGLLIAFAFMTLLLSITGYLG